MKSRLFFVSLNLNCLPYFVSEFFLRMFSRNSSCTRGNCFVSSSNFLLAFAPRRSTTRLSRKWIKRLRNVWNLDRPLFHTRRNSDATKVKPRKSKTNVTRPAVNIPRPSQARVFFFFFKEDATVYSACCEIISFIKVALLYLYVILCTSLSLTFSKRVNNFRKFAI